MFSRPTAFDTVGNGRRVLLLTLNTYMNHLPRLDLKAAPVVIRADSAPLAATPRFRRHGGRAPTAAR